MTSLIAQILGCLLVAAGIGSAVGWLLRNLSSDQLKQQYLELNLILKTKEKALEAALYDAKVKTSAIQILESKLQSAETLIRSTQRELSTSHDRAESLERALSVDKQRLATLEAAEESVRQRASALDAVAAEQAAALHQSHTAHHDATQALELKEQERLLLQQRVAELEIATADADRLRRRVEELEPFQGRIHWLEVQMSDRDAEHRAMYHQLESQLADRDRQLTELDPLRQRLEEREDRLHRSEAAHAKTLAQQETLTARLQQQHTLIDELRAQIAREAQRVSDKDEQMSGLQDRILLLESQQAAMTGQAQMVGEKEEEINRLRKRLVEVRAALRIRADGDAIAPRQTRSTDDQLNLQIGLTKPTRAPQKDDLKSIHGIGPVLERTLNKMGIITFQQIAKWKTHDLKQMAEKLATAPDRIKRDKWIAEAKKEHFRKYGERL